jgi:hypothetical protein
MVLVVGGFGGGRFGWWVVLMLVDVVILVVSCGQIVKFFVFTSTVSYPH